MLRKIWKTFAYLLFLAIATLLLLEICYRWYVVDFYGANLRALNQEELTVRADLPSVLVIGDSFSADQESYVRTLRDSLRSHRIINAAVPGTGVRQQSRLLRRRLLQFQPELLIYQLYVGNDLLDFRHPTSGPGLNWQRQLYWWLADRLLVLGYINAQLPAVRHAFFPYQQVDYDAKTAEQFSPATYSPRTKMLLRAEPDLLENSITLAGPRLADIEEVSKQLVASLALVPDTIPVLIVIMPHCVQLGEPYVDRMIQLEAQVTVPSGITAERFAFYTYLEAVLTDERTSVLSALPWLAAADATTTLYYANDPHLTPAGQQIVGDSLLRPIRYRLGPR